MICWQKYRANIPVSFSFLPVKIIVDIAKQMNDADFKKEDYFHFTRKITQLETG